MFKVILFSIPIILWSAIELPRIKKDYALKGIITYVSIMSLTLVLMTIYLLDIEIPSFYDLWTGILSLIGLKF